MVKRLCCIWILALFLVGCGHPAQIQQVKEIYIREPVEASAPPVEQEISRHQLEEVLIIGDFRVCGMQEYGCFPQADFICSAEMSVYNVWDSGLTYLLSGREYQCVVICLGLNEAGYPLEGLIRAYQRLVSYVIQTQPQAQIILHGIITVGREQAAQVSYTHPENLTRINAAISKIAGQYRVDYLDANEVFADTEGYLLKEYSPNGCHFNETAVRRWYGWLWDEINDLE